MEEEEEEEEEEENEEEEEKEKERRERNVINTVAVDSKRQLELQACTKVGLIF